MDRMTEEMLFRVLGQDLGRLPKKRLRILDDGIVEFVHPYKWNSIAAEHLKRHGIDLVSTEKAERRDDKWWKHGGWLTRVRIA